MKPLKIAVLVSAVLLTGALLFTLSAAAKQISIQGNSPSHVAKGCSGTYFPPGNKGVYGCMNSDGSGIVCGGKGTDPKTGASFGSTCDTFMKLPPRLPTRDEILNAEKDKSTH